MGDDFLYLFKPWKNKLVAKNKTWIFDRWGGILAMVHSVIDNILIQ